MPPLGFIFVPRANGAFFWSPAGTLEVFIDGQKVLTRDDRQAVAANQSAQRLEAVPRRSPRSGQISEWHRAFSPCDHGSHRRIAASSEHSEFHASDSEYASAALHYREGDFAAGQLKLRSSRRIAAGLVTPSRHPAPLHFFGKALA